MDLVKLIRETRVVREQLQAEYGEDAAIPLISQSHPMLHESREGLFFEASPYVAAPLLVKHSHRIATAEEAVFHRAQLVKHSEQLRKVEVENRMNNSQLVAVLPYASQQIAEPPAAPVAKEQSQSEPEPSGKKPAADKTK